MITDRKPSASASIIASAIVAILGSLLTLLTASLGFIGLSLPKTASATAAQPPGIHAISLITLAIIFGFGIFGIFCAVALWRLRNWARMAFLIYSGVMVFFCAFSLAAVWFILPSLPTNQPHMAGFLRIFLAAVYGVPIAIGLWWLILFNRRGIAQQFAPQAVMLDDGVTPALAKPSCPLPLAILAWFELISACCMPLLFLMPLPIPAVLFGHAFFGKPAAAIYILLSITLAVCGIGLLKLWRWSYSLLIGYHVFFSASSVFGLLNPNTWAAMNEMIGKMRTSYPGPAIVYTHAQYVASSLTGLVLAMGILTMILFYRAAFYEQSERKKNFAATSTAPPALSPTAPQNLT
jgi:hypothetical protein